MRTHRTIDTIEIRKVWSGWIGTYQGYEIAIAKQYAPGKLYMVNAGKDRWHNLGTAENLEQSVDMAKSFIEGGF